MTNLPMLSADVLFAYSAYFVGTASPGPSNLAIMSIASTDGRKAAFSFAAGVVCGSCFWAMLAALGLSAALLAYSGLMAGLKIFGGCYLLYLAFKSGRSALRPRAAQTQTSGEPLSLRRIYTRGLLMHLTNPKAILVWISVVALASPANGGAPHMLTTVAGCLAIGMLVFGSYAALFSTPLARRVYLSIRRWLDGGLAVVFGLAGLKILTSRA
ncbi:LysE family translocator [Paraburkholderia sabiae]|jgi:threonine/homoserine/homoserine lactone efflux protein|uniref:LysE family translocator n=1 Tax=Paraburkholderia sabiae TaxID=273251 RepID=A0ABU9QGW2_9BURK|nr:LysE family translocator [Paraburkholderia sabiae]WJZ75883.1 LysE family translocator [Paraburkholderia sabiae]CAD6554591.1 Threonine efflux protein [Paraburkholderia sabiae]CAG9224767.1 L-lysine permease [Paraburkholderia sabiae]